MERVGTKTVKLRFGPGGREGYRWSSISDDGKPVGLCPQKFCEICKAEERRGLADFHGGEIEVSLTLHRRPSFWETREFYLGHLVKILPQEEDAEDEGLEYDVSKLNVIVCQTPQGIVVIDPGSMGFEGKADFDRFLLTIAGKKVLVIVVSHGHMDHWIYLGEFQDGPIFMPETAFKLASRHASWRGGHNLVAALGRSQLILPGEPVLLDDLPVDIETFPMSHSIPETMGLVVKGQIGRLVHLGDFRLNDFNSDSRDRTIEILTEIAREPVDYVSLNIVNAHFEGLTPVESSVIDTISDIMVASSGSRVIITCFSSNLERIRRLGEVAKSLGRPIQFFGAGMKNARELLGIESEGDGWDKPAVFVTGCQAEENSFLWKVIRGYSSAFEFHPDDILISSARCIPGNEERLRDHYAFLLPMVDRIILNDGEIEQIGLHDLAARERIKEADVHRTGHEQGGGLELVLKILRPRKGVIAYPQTDPQIGAFRKIAESLGLEVLPENQRIIEI